MEVQVGAVAGGIAVVRQISAVIAPLTAILSVVFVGVVQ
jgi:hypothetical protein